MTSPPPNRLLRGVVEEVPAGGADSVRPGARAALRLAAAAPGLHLGHAAALRKLAALQEGGCTAVIVLGDYGAQLAGTAAADAERAASAIATESLTLLDASRTELRRDSEWLDMPMGDLFDLARDSTVGELVEHDDFERRLASEDPISILELLGPLLDAYGSIAVDADLELAGADRAPDLRLARHLQQARGRSPAVSVALALLPGTDGRPMSRRDGNAILLADPPEDMFGKLMRVPDEAMPRYFELLLDEPFDPARPAVESKRGLARQLVERHHSAAAARAAEERFDRIHVRHEAPAEIDEATLPPGEQIHLPALIGEHFDLSRSEARRLIAQGGVRIDGVPATALDVPAAALAGTVLQVGKRRFVRFVAAP